MREFERWKYPIIGAVAGLLLAVLLLTLGFLKALLILLLVVAGAGVGYLVQKSGIVGYLMRK
ncbi:DUF2273 domain-containing protein [Streptococcus parasuis]|uniref:DUF2273 domain-containing protein n=1 Tax=Streptococcus parasuis TaxID=1501662 RepID=UPI004063C959